IPLGEGINPVTKAKETVGRITTPWEFHVTEPAPGQYGLRLGNKETGSETAIRYRVDCSAQAGRFDFTGELNLAFENGTLIGAAPAKVKFTGAESGQLESEIGPGTISG